MANFHAELDSSRLPLVLMKWVGSPDDTAGFDPFLAELLQAGKRSEGLHRRMPIVVDASEASTLSSSMRQHMADWIRRNRDLVEKVVLSVHVCITNPLVRGVLTAITWVSPELEMVHVHHRVDGALAAALADLREAGQHVTVAGRPAPSSRRDPGI